MLVYLYHYRRKYRYRHKYRYRRKNMHILVRLANEKNCISFKLSKRRQRSQRHRVLRHILVLRWCENYRYYA